MDEHIEALQTERTTLEKELNDIAVFDARTGDWVAKPEEHTSQADPNMTADTTEGWNERRAMMAQLETRWRHVMLALQKTDSGTFGICEICDEHIEDDRMHVNAAARTCKIHLERERELPL